MQSKDEPVRQIGDLSLNLSGVVHPMQQSNEHLIDGQFETQRHSLLKDGMLQTESLMSIETGRQFGTDMDGLT